MYIFAVVFLSFFAFLEVFNKDVIERNKTIFVFLCFTFLVVHDGLRWETGCDWIPYSEYFDDLLLDYSIEKPVYEIGYYLFLLPIRTVTDNYSVYLIIHALLFYSLIFYAAFKLSSFPFVSLLLLYMVIVPYMGTNRQLLAIAFYMLGLLALTKDRKGLFVLLVIAACLFHRSAIICIVALLLNRRIKNLYLYLILLLSIGVATTGIINELSPLLSTLITSDEDMEKFNVYSTNTYDVSLVSIMLSLLRKLIWIAFLIAFGHKIENKPKLYYLFFNLYFIGCVFYVLFNGTLFQVIVFRGMLYFNISEMFIIPFVLLLFKANYGKLLIMLILSVYVVINIEKGFANYGEGTDYFKPYKGLFINTKYERQDQ